MPSARAQDLSEKLLDGPLTLDTDTHKIDIPCTPGNGTTLRVFVSTHAGKTISFEVDNNSTVEQVKHAVRDMESVLPTQMRLFYKDKELENAHTLAHYGFKDGGRLEDRGPPPAPPAGLFQLFSHADTADCARIFFGVLGAGMIVSPSVASQHFLALFFATNIRNRLAAANGAIFPIFSLIFGDIMDAAGSQRAS